MMTKYPRLMKKLIAFFVSMILTGAALWIAVAHLFPTFYIILIIVTLAATQVFIQLRFFMHIAEQSERYKVTDLFYGFFIAAVIIIGSVWIVFY